MLVTSQSLTGKLLQLYKVLLVSFQTQWLTHSTKLQVQSTRRGDVESRPGHGGGGRTGAREVDDRSHGDRRGSPVVDGPSCRSHRRGRSRRTRRVGLTRRIGVAGWAIRGPGGGVGGQSTALTQRATKYLACGWWQMMAEVVCSGWYCHPVSSLTSMPRRPASNKRATVALSSRSGHAGYPHE